MKRLARDRRAPGIPPIRDRFERGEEVAHAVRRIAQGVRLALDAALDPPVRVLARAGRVRYEILAGASAMAMVSRDSVAPLQLAER